MFVPIKSDIPSEEKMENEEIDQIRADIEFLREEVQKQIKTLALEFRNLVECSKLEDDPKKSVEVAAQKLNLEVHTLKIDHAARTLIQIIRRLKEIKITDDSYQEERKDFEHQCLEAAQKVQNCISDCYAELSQLSTQGFEIVQSASKLIR